MQVSLHLNFDFSEVVIICDTPFLSFSVIPLFSFNHQYYSHKNNIFFRLELKKSPSVWGSDSSLQTAPPWQQNQTTAPGQQPPAPGQQPQAAPTQLTLAPPRQQTQYSSTGTAALPSSPPKQRLVRLPISLHLSSCYPNFLPLYHSLSLYISLSIITLRVQTVSPQLPSSRLVLYPTSLTSLVFSHSHSRSFHQDSEPTGKGRASKNSKRVC